MLLSDFGVKFWAKNDTLSQSKLQYHIWFGQYKNIPFQNTLCLSWKNITTIFCFAIADILSWPCIALTVVWLLYWEPMEQKMSSEKAQLIAKARDVQSIYLKFKRTCQHKSSRRFDQLERLFIIWRKIILLRRGVTQIYLIWAGWLAFKGNWCEDDPELRSLQVFHYSSGCTPSPLLAAPHSHRIGNGS